MKPAKPDLVDPVRQHILALAKASPEQRNLLVVADRDMLNLRLITHEATKLSPSEVRSLPFGMWAELQLLCDVRDAEIAKTQKGG